MRAASTASREGLVVVVAGLLAILVLLGLGFFVTPDTWLALVAGRLVARDGPPATDTLAAWTAGRDWVDQQWLGQWLLYVGWRAGGLVLVGVAHAAVVIATFCLALLGARRREGTPGAVALVGLLAITPILLVAGNIRTQTFALPLFVGVLWLLAADSRRPSARVLWTLPLLLLWANVHGSVLIGVALAVLAGLLRLDAVRRGAAGGRTVGFALVIAPLATLVATPYGTRTLSYFRDVLGSREIKAIAPEWMAPALEPVQIPFFLLAGLTLVLLGRNRDRLTLFEQLVLVGSLIGALQAARNLAWFGLAATLLLPVAWPAAAVGPMRLARFRAPLALSAVIGVSVAAAVGVRQIDDHVDARYPPAGAAAVATAARDPTLELFTHPRYSDWLVLLHPELAGRVSFDIRYELLGEREARRFRRFRDQIGDEWRGAAGPARLVVMDSSETPLDGLAPTSALLLRERGAQSLYAAHDVAVVLRPGGTGAP